MKKYRLHIGMSIAIAMLLTVSCQQNEVLDNSKPENTKLQFSTSLGAAQTATRAGESDNDVLKIASTAGNGSAHIELHTYTGTPGSSLKAYFSDKLGYFKSENYWDINSGNVHFLPPGGMNLYAYFATDYANNGKMTEINYLPPATMTDYPKLNYTVANQGALQQLDLIAAKVENISNPNILISFRHILSQINFGVKGIDQHQIMIKNIRIHNVYGVGTFDYQSWMWSPENTPTHSYPYYFPDRKETNTQGGLGDNYYTQGTDDDSKNIYIFGDGGKFGPGNANTFFYAQTDPTKSTYETQENTSLPLHNSLMLIPQEIKENSAATVTFDYEITMNKRVIRSHVNSVIRLDPYYDWKPNLRYVYLFDFSDPSEKITFDVLLNPWENWDSDGNDTGIKNGTIQQPTANTLNTINDGETIYLLGLLERNLVWDWSDGSKYTFDKMNTLTLNFSGVETKGYSVKIIIPEGFTIPDTDENPSKGGKITIKRDSPILLEPTSKQLNFIKNGETIKLYGTLATNVTWDWAKVDFTSLEQNGSFTLDFSNDTFNNGQSITLQLPENIKATGTGLTESNPYTVTATPITITNHRVNAVIEPIAILDVVADHSVINVNGGNVSTSGETWDWSEHSFANLDPQESFTLSFSGVTFNGPIGIKLPSGFRAYKEVITKASTYNVTDNTYNITDNGRVTIKNNKIIYPPTSRVNALSDGAIITLVGETLDSDANLDWRDSTNFIFPNLPPQAAFTLDASEVDFSAKQLILSLPTHFALSESNSPVSNPYTFNTGTSVVVRNDRIQKPSDTQLNNVLNGSTITMTNGGLFMDEQWDWSMLPFTSLGRSGNSFTLAMSGINLNGKSLAIKLPPNCVATGGNVSAQGNSVYSITSGTGNVKITDNRITLPTTTELNNITQDGTIIINGGSATLQSYDVWNWSTVAFTSLGGPGNSFTINISGIAFDGKTIELKLPNGFTASGTNVAYSSFGVYNISDTGILTIKDSRQNITGGKPILNNAVHGSRIVLVGTLSALQQWLWTDLPTLASGEWFEIDYSQTNADGQYYFYIDHYNASSDQNPYSVSGAAAIGWAITLSHPNVNNGIARFTKK